jgi:hypothetical protein
MVKKRIEKDIEWLERGIGPKDIPEGYFSSRLLEFILYNIIILPLIWLVYFKIGIFLTFLAFFMVELFVFLLVFYLCIPSRFHWGLSHVGLSSRGLHFKMDGEYSGGVFDWGRFSGIGKDMTLQGKVVYFLRDRHAVLDESRVYFSKPTANRILEYVRSNRKLFPSDFKGPDEKTLS